MTSNMPISLKDLKRDPFKVLEIGYKILFFPYATIFTLYIILGILVGAVAYYAGIDKDYISYQLAPLFLGGGLVVYFLRAIARRISNWRARKKSLNPFVSILNE